MPPKWFTVYRESDGSVISTGTVIADPLPPGMVKKALSGRPDPETDWNPETLRHELRPIPAPAIDRVEEFMAHLVRVNRDEVRAELAVLLGDFRFRDESVDYVVEDGR